MTLDEMRETLMLCQFPGVVFQLNLHDGEDHPCLRVASEVDGQWMYGRKWRLSKHMTKSEVVQTAFLAIKTWEEHELREKFTYKGKAIFGPHLDAEVLHQVADYLDARRTAS